MIPRVLSLALLGFGLSLGVAALAASDGRASAPRGSRPASSSPAEGPRSDPTGAEVPASAAVPVAAAERRERIEPPPAHAAPLVVPKRAPAAVRELAALLAREPFDHAGFERAVQALASGLAREELDPLRAAIERTERPLAERLAACELLRATAPRPGIVPERLRVELLALVRAPESGALGESAARALVALGDEDDARTLIAALGHWDEAVRARCTRALASGAALPERTRAALVAELDRAVALSPGGLAAPATARALAALRPAAPADSNQHERALLAPEATAAERLAAASELVRERAGLSPATLAVARDVLVAGAESELASERRRALYALGALADPTTLLIVSRAAVSDEDDAVRSAAVRSLGAFGETIALDTIASADPSPEVRALAAQELAAAHRASR